jgi:hypothetical protein
LVRLSKSLGGVTGGVVSATILNFGSGFFVLLPTSENNNINCTARAKNLNIYQPSFFVSTLSKWHENHNGISE